MTALMDATAEDIAALSAVTEMLVEVERTIGSLLAARDGLLALGSRIAVAAASHLEEPNADAADLSARAVAAEFGAALRLSDRTVQRRMLEAEIVVTQFPLVWRAQGAGLITGAHSRVIVDAGAHLDDDRSRDAYAAQMVTMAQSESPNRVARMARRIADRYQRRSVDDRHADARRRREVRVKDRADGMAELSVLGPATLVHGAFARLTEMTKDTRAMTDAPHDDRTLGQTRCDLALDVLLTGAPGGHDTADGALAAIRASVSVTVPVLSLMGVGSSPAELDGCVPIDLGTARALAGAAPGWDRILTHPVSGAVLAVDRYRPSAALKRHLAVRDQRCRFPTCGYPVKDCDLDHTQDHALGGTTESENLGSLCRRHHTLKHSTPWHVEHLGDGVFFWTSPTGRVHLDRPLPTSAAPFPDDPEPPF